MEETKTHDDGLITVAGGVEMEVIFQDGTKENVKVRQIPLSKIQEFSTAVAFSNMADAVDLYCDKEKGWADRLSYESARAVMDKGCELNLPFFGAWLKDQKRWRAAFGIVLDGAEESKEIQQSRLESSPRPSPTTTNLVPEK
jgi:hypothetical protein